MADIQRNIGILRVIVWATIAMVLAGQLWFWLAPESFELISATHPIISDYGGIERLNTMQRVLGFFVTLLPKAALVWAMILLLQLTRALKAGQWFDTRSEKLCNRIGRWLVIYVGLTILHRTLLVLVITMTNPVGERQLAFSLSTDDLMALVPALLAMIIGHMVKLARAQRDELNEII